MCHQVYQASISLIGRPDTAMTGLTDMLHFLLYDQTHKLLYAWSTLHLPASRIRSALASGLVFRSSASMDPLVIAK